MTAESSDEGEPQGMDETQDNRTLHCYEVESDGLSWRWTTGYGWNPGYQLEKIPQLLKLSLIASEDARFEESTSSQGFSNEGVTSSEPFDHNEAVILSEEHNHNEDISPGEEYECHNASAEASDHSDEIHG